MDLTTPYLGLQLRCPVVASPGPLSQTVDGIKELADSGVGAVVMYSLMEEQVRHERARMQALEEMHDESYAESLSYFPVVPNRDDSFTSSYLKLLERGAAAIDVPLIGSLNGATHGGWTDTARQFQDAGAAAIELNVYFVPGDVHTDGASVERRYLEIVQAVNGVVDIPIAVKMGPYFSSLGSMATRLVEAGADGLVLFNRFLQPEVDVEAVDVVPGVELSHQSEGRLPRTWIAALRHHLNASLAGTSGVETPDDVVKYILAGADVAMTTSALLRHGPGHAAKLIGGLTTWLERKQLTLDKARGLLAVPVDVSADEYERAGYVAALEKAKLVWGR